MNIILILLERALERKDKMSNELKKIKGEHNILIYSAFDGSDILNESYNLRIVRGYRDGDNLKKGELGCTLSHIGALKMAKALNWDNVIILEDDIELCDDLDIRINKLFNKLPKNWEHIYLSGYPRHQNDSLYTNGMELLVPSIWTDCTHSYMLRNTAYDKVISFLTSLLTTTDDLYNQMIIGLKTLKSYTYYPFISYANPDKSYIWDSKINTEHPSKRFYKKSI